MGRPRRLIEKGSVYELCFRAKESIPFPVRFLISLIIKAVIARTQRDLKIILCHHIWMGNHAHQMVVAKDAKAFTQYRNDLQKRITECLKCLLGKENLLLWEGRGMAANIENIETAKSRLFYFFSNTKRDLNISIQNYKGLNSWSALENKDIREWVPWIQVENLSKLSSVHQSEDLDKEVINEFSNKAKAYFLFDTDPDAWLRAFGITDSIEIAEQNRSIIDRVLAYEKAELLDEDTQEHFTINKEIMRPHTPSKKGRSIVVLSNCTKRRKDFQNYYRQVCLDAKLAYQEMLKGGIGIWPPGTFPAPHPLMSNSYG